MAGLLSLFVPSAHALSTTNANQPHHLTIFENMGDLVTDTSYIHIMSTIDLRQYEDMFASSLQMLNEQTKRLMEHQKYKDATYYNPGLKALHELNIDPIDNSSNASPMFSIEQRLKNVRDQFWGIRAMLPQRVTATSQASNSRITDIVEHNTEPVTKSVVRVKRGAAAAIIASVVAMTLGTFLGLYSQTQISNIGSLKDSDLLLHLQEKNYPLFDNLGRRIDLAHRILLDNGMVYTAERHEVWDAILEQLHYRLDQFETLMEALQSHRISLTWFSEKQMQEIHEAVKIHASHAGLKPLTSQLADYSQIEVSYALRNEEVVLILHVPATMDDSIWTVFRYIPFPIPQSNGQVMLIETPEDVIAVGHNGEYKVMSKPDFDKCIRRNHYLICEQPMVSSTNMSATCIGSLMAHNPNGISAHCEVKMKDAQEMVYQTASNQFAVYSPTTYTATGSCADKTALSFLISQYTQITVPQGCKVRLSQHNIKVSASVIGPRIPWTFNSQWDTMEVPRKILSRVYAQEDEMRRTYDAENQHLKSHFFNLMDNATASASSLHQQFYDRLHNGQSRTRTGLIILGGILASIAVIVMILWCCYYIRRSPTPHFSDTDSVRMSFLPGVPSCGILSSKK